MESAITFAELQPELQDYIAQPSAFDGWARAIVSHVAPAVRTWGEDYGSGGLAIWDVVRVVSWRRSVLVEKLSREKFAKLVCTVCPALGTPGSLNASLKKSAVSEQKIRKYDQLPPTDWVKKYGLRIDELFDQAESAIPPAVSRKSHVDFLGEALCTRVHPNSLLNHVKHNKIYTTRSGGSVQPAWSIETYQTRTDMEHELFSQVMAFEWVDGHVTMDILSRLLMGYLQLQPAGFKLVVVSTCGFAADVVKAAKDYYIGLTRLNPDADLDTALEVVVRRTINNAGTERRLAEALSGGQMSGLMLVLDGDRLTTLADMMLSRGIAVNRRYLWDVPFLSKPEIASIAETLRTYLRKNPLQQVISQIARKYGTTQHDYAVDELEELAQTLKLEITMQAMPDDQYACLNLARRRIILNSKIKSMPLRHPGTADYIIRFSISHELGHYFMHARRLCDHIESFTETDASLSVTQDGSEKVKRMEWQANYFASCLLMPEESVRQLLPLLLTEDERSLLETNGLIREEHIGRSRLHAVIEQMSRRMEVSKQAMRIRLSELSLLPSAHEGYAQA